MQGNETITVSGIHIPLVASNNIEMNEFDNLENILQSVPYANSEYVEAVLAEEAQSKLTSSTGSFSKSEKAIKILDANNLLTISLSKPSSVLNLPPPQAIEADCKLRFLYKKAFCAVFPQFKFL